MLQNDNLYAVFVQRSPAPERPALVVSADRIITYGQLEALTARYAEALLALGVAPGDRITVQAEKSVGYVALYLATLKIGAVFNPLNTAYQPAELDYFIADAEPSVVVTAPDRLAVIAPLARRHGVAAVETLDAPEGGSLAERAAAAAGMAETAHRQRDDIAAILYTSGTTGRSKGAMISHGNLASNITALHEAWAFEPGDVLLHALPVFHVHGLFVALGTALYGGISMLWLPKFDIERVMALLPEATVMMGVPTFYTRLLAQPDFTAERVRHVRLFVSGSAPLLAETHRQFAARTGHRILERYGMTEAGMITTNPYRGERIAGTVGYPLPGVSLRIVDDEGRELPDGEPGGIEIKGPNVFKGYWRMPEKTAEDFRADGYFITGDVGVKAADGRVSIVGRQKDLIISGGFNVYPKEIEDALDRLDGIAESAVIGVPHPDFGEGVIAVVAGDGGMQRGEADVIGAIAGDLARFKVPKRVFYLEELPRNAMGKVQKAELRKRFARTFVKG